MSYKPTNWQTGDTITAEKLNHIEQGLFEAVDSIIILNDKAEPFIVTLTPTAQDFSGTMDKTCAEISAAVESGRRVLFDIQSLGARAEATQFYYSGGVWFAYAMVEYAVSSQDVLVLIKPISDYAYSTNIFLLTSM